MSVFPVTCGAVYIGYKQTREVFFSLSKLAFTVWTSEKGENVVSRSGLLISCLVCCDLHIVHGFV